MFQLINRLENGYTCTSFSFDVKNGLYLATWRSMTTGTYHDIGRIVIENDIPAFKRISRTCHATTMKTLARSCLWIQKDSSIHFAFGDETTGTVRCLLRI